jgi:predicted HTH domain antitoxin
LIDRSLHADPDVLGLSPAELESLVLKGYASGDLSEEQVRRLLGLKSRFDVHALLKERDMYLNYGQEDLEDDLKFSDSWSSSPTHRH